MIAPGIKASELVKQLQQLIEEHGDQQVFAGGGDYPGGVGGVDVQRDRNPYVPKGVFYIRSRS